jgi:hypothetical protein
MQVACGQPSRFYGHLCIADEHFVATLLAAYGLDQQRDGVGRLTYTDWLSSQGAWHPKTFYPGDAFPSLYTMRSVSAATQCAPQPLHACMRMPPPPPRPTCAHASHERCVRGDAQSEPRVLPLHAGVSSTL